MGVADYFRLSTREATEVLAHLSTAVRGWRAAAASHGLAHTEIDMMAPAFEHAEAERAREIGGDI